MIDKHERIAITSDWLLPITSPPVPNGWIVIRDGTVDFVGSQLPAMFSSAKQFKLDGFAILPGLINCHCHLEFSDLLEPLAVGNSFAEWIGKLIAHRRQPGDSPEQKANSRRRAIAAGIRESYVSGVRWVVDMTTKPWERTWIENAVAELLSDLNSAYVPDSPIVAQPCVEILDIAQPRLAETLQFASEQLHAPVSRMIGEMGYAPHSPYTTSLSATEKCVELAREYERLVTMHLGESADEMAWIEHQNGGFRELLGPIIGQGYFEGLGQLSDYLTLLATARRSLIAHGNYFSDDDLKMLAVRSQTMAIVHCPRTHRHFGHQHLESQQYPLAQRQSIGVKHLLGTDSRASNPDLNLWSEAKQIRADHPSITSESIVRMVTLDAARFLGLDSHYGTVRSGVSAMLTAVQLGGDRASSNQPTGTQYAYDLVLGCETKSSPLELVLAKFAQSTTFEPWL